MAKPLLVLLDTDIGSDIDDALALLLLLRLPDAELLGITTVYGKVALRARIARRILEAAGRDVPVIAGAGIPMSSPIPVWHTGIEGAPLLNEQEIAAAASEGPRGIAAAEFLVQQCLRSTRPLRIVAIGALTNIALALELDPSWKNHAEEIVFMGGGINYPHPLPSAPREGIEYVARPSHNVLCDVEAARRVFESGLRITVLTNDVTCRLWWDGEPVRRLLGAVHPADAAAVAAMLRAWLSYRSRRFGQSITGTCPHDPLTVCEAVFPGSFVEYTAGRLIVHHSGHTSFTVEREGPHRLAYLVDRRGFLEWFSSHLVGRESAARGSMF